MGQNDGGDGDETMHDACGIHVKSVKEMVFAHTTHTHIHTHAPLNSALNICKTVNS